MPVSAVEPDFGFEWAEPHRLANTVVIVANSADEDSVRLAHYYASRRGIPRDRIIALPLPERETISRAQFNRAIFNPLLRELVDRGFIEAILSWPEEPTLPVEATVIANRVRYLVLCRGVPLRVSEDRTLDETALIDRLLQRAREGRSTPVREEFLRAPLDRNNASVDSELATLALGPVPRTGIIENRLFRDRNVSASTDVVRVLRLDGPTFEDARGLVDSALEGEQSGLRGRVYIDQDGRGGGFQLGNDWLARAHELWVQAGFSAHMDTARPLIGYAERFDAPAVYMGWYAGDVEGPFVLPGFRFPPGAIAIHIHSFSARSLRDAERGWTAPFVARGVAATVGNVHEPFLGYTHYLDLLSFGLLTEMNWGDAAYFSLPALSWQNITLGDPLYEPFRQPLDAQLDVPLERDPLALYARIRSLNATRRDGSRVDAETAADLTKQWLGEFPHPALVFDYLERSGPALSRSARQEFLRQWTPVPLDRPDEWGLYLELARRSGQEGAPDAGVRLFRLVFADDRLPESMLTDQLGPAAGIAFQAGERELSQQWRERLNSLRDAAGSPP
ncbi:MAG: TIGR03790 family protein [Opitutales bacterium]|nr:TIGR03790 family protein [Opitutales bacterium]